METIGELLSRDLSRKIEEIIQVDQADQQAVHAEITEYIATDSIRDQYGQLLRAVAEAPSEPHEGIGVWISGFFGSGKSSFAKNLGYALENRKVLGKNFSDLFKKQIDDRHVDDLLDLVNTRIPTEVILFEVAKERDTRKVTERIAELMYTVLLRELDYAEDFDVAELEIELEVERKLDQFVQTCETLYPEGWRMVRKGAQKLSRASRVLHEIDPQTYPSADSWSHAQRNREAAITVSKVVERTFELWGRRRPGKALAFIIDEVGQHVARSGDKIEDLRATIEEFGKVSKNLLKARKIIAPCWIVVTSQEKLDEVVAAIDSKRVDLAKLQDRFRFRVDLAPSDIREVATRRVLAKRPEGEPRLRKLFADNQGKLNAALRLERTTRRAEVNEDDFVQFYPYAPHYIELCIGIMSGIRLQPGAPRHYGGSNRTIIKQAYEMLVSERTAFAKKPIGALVTLDKVFELVEGNLSNEKRTDIHEISQRFQGEKGDWPARVAKVICLLEFVRDLPRTEANIAAFLIDEVGCPTPLGEVKTAIEQLHAAKFVRNTEDGWKLQTAQEKTWETERQGHLEPKPRDRNEITRQTVKEVFGDTALKTFRYRDLRTFRIGLSVDGAAIGDEGDLPLSLRIADDGEDLNRKLGEMRDESRQEAHKNEVYWGCSLSPEIDDVVAHLHASRKMVEKYDQMRAQNKISTDETTCLQDEKHNALGYESRLRDKLTEAIEKGTGMFRGVQKDAAGLGKNLGEIFKKLFASAVPDLYPKLEMGSRPLEKDDPEKFLKAADLKALPQVFYEGEKGLGLVVKDGAKLVLNTNAAVAKEVFDYLAAEHGYGNKESRTGKALERRFGGIGYGWERDVLRLILAVLFRSGAIEVTYQGNRFHNYQDPVSRTPFANNVAFRSSLFSPRQSVGLKTLTTAVQQLEDITGEEVDVEEGAIAAAFKKVAGEELEKLHPLKALAEAHELPIRPLLTEYQQTLLGIQASASDDCVRILTETGASFQETREKVRKLRESLDQKAVGLVRQARLAIEQAWPRLLARGPAPGVAKAVNELKELLVSERFGDSLGEIAERTQTILGSYKSAYLDLFDRRAEAYEKAIEEVKNRPEWEPLSRGNKEVAETLLAPLAGRIGSEDDRAAVADGSGLGKASLMEMESDLAAVEALRATALVKLQELALGGGQQAPVQRVRVSALFNRPIQTQEDLNAALDQIRSTLQKLVDEGTAIILE
ncbi:MAG: BREX system P-loop protein BrxC [Pirellulales bacterium]